MPNYSTLSFKKGIPEGMRFSVGGEIDIVSEHGGRIEIDYRTFMLASKESFHIYIDYKEVHSHTFEDSKTTTPQGLTV